MGDTEVLKQGLELVSSSLAEWKQKHALCT